MPPARRKDGQLSYRHLTRQEVLEIRAFHERGETIRDIARAYKLPERTISNVVHHRTHRRVRPGKWERIKLPTLEEINYIALGLEQRVEDPEGYHEDVWARRDAQDKRWREIVILEALPRRTMAETRHLRDLLAEYKQEKAALERELGSYHVPLTRKRLEAIRRESEELRRREEGLAELETSPVATETPALRQPKRRYLPNAGVWVNC